MRRTIKVERIFPLERFGNIHITNELEFPEDDDSTEVDIIEAYDRLVREVYSAGLNHHELVKETKLVDTVEEKREVLYGRD